MRTTPFVAVGLFFAASVLRAGDLLVQLPVNMAATSATASTPGNAAQSEGTIQNGVARFSDLKPGLFYDLKIDFADEIVVQGIDMRWHDAEPPRPNAGEFNDDDRAQVQAILNVPSFFNRSEILALRGDHDRAVVLNQLVRDQSFYGDKNGEIIWRVELGYFKNEHGGWAKLPQVTRIVRRERFPSKADFQRAVAKLKWAPKLGGISVPADGDLKIALSSLEEPPNTRPSGDDDAGG
jgi:hypothetical protein